MHKITLSDVARTCDKIEVALARKVFDIKLLFAEVDPKCSGLISDAKFIDIVYNQLGQDLGVCRDEVKELADYFKQQDCCVCYEDFLQLVLPLRENEKSFVTGLEWEDHHQVNVLSPFELRHLNLILTKIAHSCHVREVYLEPHFKDHERMSCYNGTVTVQHFRRILNFVGITLGCKEFQVLVKRFQKHGYTMNYIAFLESISEIMCWFEKNGFLGCDRKFKENCPGRIIVANIDSLPRPEVCKVDIANTFGREKACHPCVNQHRNYDTKFEQLMIRIKKHIYDNRIRTRQFFEIFDDLRRGFVTKSQFHRGLDAIGLSGLHRLYVAPHDLEKIVNAYRDLCDPDRVGWSKFCDDIDDVFTIKCLDKQPYRVVSAPQDKVKEILRPGTANWDCVPKQIKHLAQETLFRLRNIIKSKRILIEPFFKDHDRKNNLHVSRCQMNRVFSTNSILISEMESQALMARYGDDLGFNYRKFLQEIDEVYFCEMKHKEVIRVLKLINDKKSVPCASKRKSVIEVFAKIKNQVSRNRINLDQFLSNGEKLNDGLTIESKFRSGFSAAGIILDDCELDILCKSFRSACRLGFVNFKKFCKMINEAFMQTNLEKRPCTVPIQHISSPDDSLNFLNFEERCIISHALQKLSRFHDDASNMKSVFKDRSQCSGYVSEQNLKQVLTVCGGLLELITQKELDLVMKCFSKETGKERNFDYRNFLMVLSHLNRCK